MVHQTVGCTKWIQNISFVQAATLLITFSVTSAAMGQHGYALPISNCGLGNSVPRILNNRIEHRCDSHGNVKETHVVYMGSSGEFVGEIFYFQSGQILKQRKILAADGSIRLNEVYQTMPNDFYAKPRPTQVDGFVKGEDIVKFNLQDLSFTTIESRYQLDPLIHFAHTMKDSYETKDGRWTGFIKTREFEGDYGTERYSMSFDTSSSGFILLKDVSYENDGVFAVVSTNPKLNESSSRKTLEAQHRLAKVRKEPIVLLESGFDVSNSDLLSRLWYNSDENIDGVDNDNDGFIDNLSGFMVSKDLFFASPFFSAYPVFTDHPKEGRDVFGDRPYCHGTFVGDLFSRNLRLHGLVPFVGDLADTSFLVKVMRWIKQRHVRFVNMSFDFGSNQEPGSSAASGLVSDSERQALENLIRSNDQSLFFVAAGNTPVNLDVNETWPTKLRARNMIVVAAVDAPDQGAAKRESGLAKFSAYGEKTVDIAAPGVRVRGINFGSHAISLSGTSMAAPIVGNLAVRMAELNPSLSIDQIKSLILKTAFIGSLINPLPVRSGGTVSDARSMLAAQLMLENPEMSTEEAALTARKLQYIPGDLSGSTEEDLIEFWRSRGL